MKQLCLFRRRLTDTQRPRLRGRNGEYECRTMPQLYQPRHSERTDTEPGRERARLFRPAPAFTLAEILLVVSMVIILMSLALVAARRMRSDAQAKQTRIALSIARNIAEEYALAVGREPLSDINSTADFVQKTRNIPACKPLYDQLRNNKLLRENTIVDAWGNELKLETTPKLVFKSAGPDGVFDTADDLQSE